MVAFESLPVDWCKVPDVKNASKNWLERQGIKIDCE